MPSRPFLATVFYVFGAISVAASIALAWWYFNFTKGILTPELRIGLATLVGLGALISCSFHVAMGYAIEKLAQIEWNTRTGRGFNTSGASSSNPNRGFFVITSGQTRGPLSTAEVVDLYRDGKLTKSSQILVEDNGYRRAVTDWSEFGL